MDDQELNMMFTQLLKASMESQLPQNSVPKIQRVVQHLLDRKHFDKFYSPRFVSIGPIHHDAENLQQGEKYKLMWAARYLERTKQDAQALYQKIASNIKELKELFAEDVVADLPDDKLSRMLFVDGCALLQILEKAKLIEPEKMNVKFDQLVLVLQDVILLENQLPYQLLKLLSYRDAKLLQTMKVFLKGHHLSPITHDIDRERQSGYRQEIEEESPNHLLDLLRDLVLNDPQKKYKQKIRHENRIEVAYKTNKVLNRAIYRNIQELKAAGIRVKKSDSNGLGDISFSNGFLRAELKLPEIIVDDSTAPMFLNLIAYEMCPDFENSYEICSFMSMMGSFIDHPDDVKELRQAGVLQNMLGRSDEEVTMLFNAINDHLVRYTTGRYMHVRIQIEKYYRNKCRTWIALGYHTYFSTPGTIIAFYAAVAALVLTFIQTWCAVKQI